MLQSHLALLAVLFMLPIGMVAQTDIPKAPALRSSLTYHMEDGKKVYQVSLSGNEIWKDSLFNAEVRRLTGSRKLATFDLSNNDISTATSVGIHSLEAQMLYLSHNRLSGSGMLSLRSSSAWQISISNNRFHNSEITLLNLTANNFFLSRNESLGTVALRNNRLGWAVIHDLTCNRFESSGNRYGEIMFERIENCDTHAVEFKRDTIGKGTFWMGFPNVSLMFLESVFNGHSVISCAQSDPGYKNDSINFIGCHFGPSSTVEIRQASFLGIYGCTFEGGGKLVLDGDESRPTKLGFYEHVPDNVKFSYDGGFELFFHPGTDFEQKSVIYESLLEKFKREGRLESYRNVDIEYRKLKNVHDGRAWLNWLEDMRWNFGYDLSLIILQTMLFFGISCIINTVFWKYMQATYAMRNLRMRAILYNGKVRYFSVRSMRHIWMSFGNVMKCFFYTIFVFFFVTIDVSRFHVKYPFAAAVFFIEHVAGLYCLYMIVNYLLGK